MAGGTLGVVGDLVEDVVVWLREPLQRATDTDVEIHRVRGGSAANVAAFAAPRHPTRFLGSVGQDASGEALVAELESHGVDVRAQRRGRTGTIVVIVDEEGERTMLPDRGASVLLEDVAPDWSDGLGHLHVPAYSFAADPMRGSATELIRRVHRQGGSVSVDASSTGMLRHESPRRFLALLAELTPELLFANAAEAELLGLCRSGLPGEERLPGTTVIVKDGPRPTTVLSPGRTESVAVAPVGRVRDLTGAGDAFAAGFLTALLAGESVTACCAAGHSVAALVLAAPGASTTA